jgi:hypothetical protein
VRRSVTLALLALAMACAGAPSDPATLVEARAAIDEAIGEARATDPAQCLLAAIGVRPCGGPREYVAYSVAETDSAELAALIAVYDRMDRERNEREGLVSTCELLAMPYTALDSGRCITTPAS